MSATTADSGIRSTSVEASSADLIGRLVTGGVALVLLFVASGLPLWQATLNAPQYPGGLRMIAYGAKVTGDIREINMLNHYIGMKAFDWSDIAERALWKPSLLAAALAIVVALAVRHRIVSIVAKAALWLFPVGILADVQFRLFQYGHDLHEGAPLRVPEFTPWVIGPTKMWNFNTWALPGTGLIVLFALAALVTFGPRAARLLTSQRLAGAAAAAIIFVAVLAAPAAAQTHDHSPQAREVRSSTVLQAMLDRARPGDRIELSPTTYHGSFKISKPVELVGNGAKLHGDGTGSVLEIAANHVRVSDLSISNSAPGPVGSPAGLAVRGKNISVHDVSISDSYFGISVRNSRDVTIENVSVRGRGSGSLGDTDHALRSSHHTSQGRADMADGRGDGIALSNSKDVTVRGSTISVARDGLYLSFATHVMLEDNEIVNGRYGIHSMYANDVTVASNLIRENVAGAVMMYGARMMLFENHIAQNTSTSTGFGLLAKDVAAIEVARNVIEQNRVGIHVEGPAGADPGDQRFLLNTVGLNGIGAAVVPSAAAVFTGNSFVENQIQVAPVGGQIAAAVEWSDKGAGNFWSDYRGFDRSHDGVGDVPYRQSGSSGRLLDENPALHALLGSPALNMAMASREKWAPADTGIVDHLPLMKPHSPSSPFAPPANGAPLILLSLLTVGAAGMLLASARTARSLPPTALAGGAR